MAICAVCGDEMNTANSCILLPVQIKRGEKVVKTLEPIRFGHEERHQGFVVEAHQRCPDCNVKKGEYHHPGCDWEECPNCHHQMLMCGAECG